MKPHIPQINNPTHFDMQAVSQGNFLDMESMIARLSSVKILKFLAMLATLACQQRQQQKCNLLAVLRTKFLAPWLAPWPQKFVASTPCDPRWC